MNNYSTKIKRIKNKIKKIIYISGPVTLSTGILLELCDLFF